MTSKPRHAKKRTLLPSASSDELNPSLAPEESARPPAPEAKSAPAADLNAARDPLEDRSAASERRQLDAIRGIARPRRRVELPCEPDEPWAVLEVPANMSARAWRTLRRVLDAMRDALVDPDEDDEAPPFDGPLVEPAYEDPAYEDEEPAIDPRAMGGVLPPHLAGGVIQEPLDRTLAGARVVSRPRREG